MCLSNVDGVGKFLIFFPKIFLLSLLKICQNTFFANISKIQFSAKSLKIRIDSLWNILDKHVCFSVFKLWQKQFSQKSYQIARVAPSLKPQNLTENFDIWFYALRQQKIFRCPGVGVGLVCIDGVCCTTGASCEENLLTKKATPLETAEMFSVNRLQLFVADAPYFLPYIWK